MMGGDVTVASESGNRSVCTLRLPGGEHTGPKWTTSIIPSYLVTLG
jgi:hypothetical protein